MIPTQQRLDDHNVFGVASISPYSVLVNAPVLLALSSGDELFCGSPPLATDCGTLRQQEAPYFAPAAQLEAYLFPGRYGNSFTWARFPSAQGFCASREMRVVAGPITIVAPGAT